MKTFKAHALYFAWVISLAGFLLSLFYGELLHFEPCRLCWYQRIFLFPLAIILGIAAYKDDSAVASYAMPLSVLGGLFALYQLMESYIPVLNTPALCGHETSCSEVLFELWGFVTFPLLSVVGFALICILLWVAKRCRVS